VTPQRIATALALVLLSTACGQATNAQTPSPSTSASPSVLAVPMPSPAADPAYPPKTLADLVGLADRGANRRFIGMEGQALGPACNRGWMRIYEPAGLAPRQMAEDLLKVSIERFAFQKSCGAYIFGTTATHYCNCYHAEHGYMEIDRGPGAEPAPGKMSVFFALNDKDTTSPEDWQVVVDAPTG